MAHTPGPCLRVASLRAAAVTPEAFDLPALLRSAADEYASLLAACEAVLANGYTTTNRAKLRSAIAAARGTT